MIGDKSIAIRPLGYTDGRIAELPLLYDALSTVMSQYCCDPLMPELVEYWAQCLDLNKRVSSIIDNLIDLDTCIGVALDVWGRRLGIRRTLKVAKGTFLGFASDSAAKSFDHGIWYSGGDITDNAVMSDDVYRTMLKARAKYNLTDASIPAINQLLLDVFGRGYVRDNQDMTMTFVFPAALTGFEGALLFQSGVIPVPACVSFDMIIEG